MTPCGEGGQALLFCGSGFARRRFRGELSRSVAWPWVGLARLRPGGGSTVEACVEERLATGKVVEEEEEEEERRDELGEKKKQKGVKLTSHRTRRRKKNKNNNY